MQGTGIKKVILVRGLPGAGKSTLLNLLSGRKLEMDDYFYFKGKGKYDYDGDVESAAKFLMDRYLKALAEEEQHIIIAGVYDKEEYIKEIKDKAEIFGYRFQSVIVENRHGNESIHNVPQEHIDRMRNDFNISL